MAGGDTETGEQPEQETFDRFGWKVPPALVARKRPVKVQADRERLVGFVGYDRRREITVYSTRRKQYHYYRKEDAYAVSEDVIEHLDDIGVARILVHEFSEDDEPSGDVYEFKTRQYRHAEAVGEDWPFEYGDKQRFVPVDEAMHHWEGYADSLFVYEWDEMWRRLQR